MIDLFTQFPCLAVEEAVVPTFVESDAGKINLESILVSIDDFFNRYPFFVAGCTFVWLVVIPLVQEYFRKYKFVSAIDAFWKLRDDPDSQLLDIRDRKNVKFLRSPNLKMLKKEVVQVEFTEGNEDVVEREKEEVELLEGGSSMSKEQSQKEMTELFVAWVEERGKRGFGSGRVREEGGGG